MALAIKPSTEETYRRHVAAVHRFCLWRTNSSYDAEDAALETRPKTPSAALSSASARLRNRTYAPSPRRSSALHLRLWAAFSNFDRPEGFSAGSLEVFVKVAAGKAEKVEPERMLGWLLKVADNECKNIARRRRRRAEAPIEFAAELAHLDGQPWISPDICRAVNRLKPTPRRVVFLKAVEDMSFKEIAAAAGITEGAAKMVFYRAIKRLAKILGDDAL